MPALVRMSKLPFHFFISPFRSYLTLNSTTENNTSGRCQGCHSLRPRFPVFTSDRTEFHSKRDRMTLKVIINSTTNLIEELADLISNYCIWTLGPGDRCDAKDPDGTWRVAQILELRITVPVYFRDYERECVEEVLVHFIGCDLLWDKWVASDSKDIEPHGVWTRGKCTATMETEAKKQTGLSLMGFTMDQINHAFDTLGWSASSEEIVTFILRQSHLRTSQSESNNPHSMPTQYNSFENSAQLIRSTQSIPFATPIEIDSD